jgi:hypothetical protein
MHGLRQVRTTTGTLLIAAAFAACGDGMTTAPVDLPTSEARNNGNGNGRGGPGGDSGESLRQDDFTEWNPDRWTAGDHPLGKGSFYPENVSVGGDLLTLRLPAGTYDGGEIRSAERLRRGIYEARIRAADAPGAITAFFLYEYDYKGSDEVDIEIFGDGTGRVMFTTWVRDRQTNHVEVVLPFDPTADFHDGIPGSAMYVMANAWWPVWLNGPPPAEDRNAAFDWIRHP